MKCFCLFLLPLFCVPLVYSQDFSFSVALYNEYETYKEPTIQHRRFKHGDIEPLIEQLAADPLFEVQQVGESVEERAIYLVRIGNGDKKVFFWSQMHGNESTATMALFDMFNFFREENDPFADLKQGLLEEVSLYFIPMLNPDGAEIFHRRNALGIDVNRDALRLTSPEARILKAVRDSLNPEFGFNLHDQSVYYTPGRSFEPATLSFLAPAYDIEQSENEVRTNAMRLISYLDGVLQHYIPGKVAKYSDEHEPRAFGDMIQKWGTSTILVESGGYPDDPEKQYIRKLNFVSLLSAIEAIAYNRFTDIPVENYYQIPENRLFLTDLIIREANMIKDGQEYLIDLSIRRSERTVGDEGLVYYRASINDLGDLSTHAGYEELEAGGLQIHPGKIYPDTLKNEQEVRGLDMTQLFREGYTDVMVENAPASPFLHGIPVNIVSQKDYSNEISLGSTPNLILKNDDGVRYVIVNGYVFDVENGLVRSAGNTLVVK